MKTMRDYPSGSSMAARWHELATAIALDARKSEGGVGKEKGRLVVLGSGLAHVDLTLDVEVEINSADEVFYCLYDRVTQVWLSRLRPDAYDLSVLYSERIDRYYTYMRMAEALLYYVRRGKKVVAILYGHPGVFATPAHRAVQIAKREGHHATMRPGISALDYLVADLGFDPALPGLLSYEASDMLLRRRRIDTSLHLVLWQVGVVGEFGFKPGGFENKGYDLLVDVLAQNYGPDWEVAHYIAPYYVGVDPLIERHRIGDLKSDQARKNISPLSTFYIEPMEAVATNQERSEFLGLTQPGQPMNPPERIYDLTRYEMHELEAIRTFDQLTVSPNYFVPEPTPGIDFMLALSRDVDLQERYRANPETVLADQRFSDLSERARKLLAIPHPMAIAAGISEPAQGVAA